MVDAEIKLWEKMDPALISKHVGSDGILDEFALVSDIEDVMPLHYLLFRMCAAHLPHEANSESTFFRAGMLSDPNLEPGMHAVLTRINGNKATYKPLSEDILARYKRNYHQEHNVEAEAFLQAMFDDDDGGRGDGDEVVREEEGTEAGVGL